MSKAQKKWMTLFGIILVLSLALGACATPTATPEPGQPTQAPAQPTQAPGQPTQAPAQPTEPPAQPTEPPAAEGPKEGGKIVIGIQSEPPTLDPAKATGDLGLVFLGAALIARAPDNTYVPWVAESWELSEDGMVWTFDLRDDVIFHDGTPLTAHDFVWTYERAIAPDTASPLAGTMLASVESFEAPDDYTLVMNMKEPMAPFMDNLVAAGFLSPLSQEYVEAQGDDYGRNPMSIGPYKLKEWVTGDHITLERNLDYNWQPAYVQHEGPYYIEEIEFRIIPEIATIVAGLEAGELDFVYGIEPQYLPRLEDTGNFNILTSSVQGGSPTTVFNVSKPPFDDLKVRQALWYAIDAQAMIEVIQQGNANVQSGPISPSVVGYWDGVEDLAPSYDPEMAKTLLAEAGWTDTNGDDVVDKDGQPFQITMPVVPDYEKEATMLQEQLRAVGMQIDIEQSDLGTVIGKIVGGEYEFSVLGFQWPNYDILWLLFHSKSEGVLNLNHVNDPELDALLDKTRSEVDLEAHTEFVNQVQQRIVEQAYMVPLYNPQAFYPMSKRVVGGFIAGLSLHLEDAWIDE